MPKPKSNPNLPIDCNRNDCNQEVQASAPLYLIKTPTGWSIEGVGDEVAQFYCKDDHKQDERMYGDDLSAWLEKTFPGLTWHGANPTNDPITITVFKETS